MSDREMRPGSDHIFAQELDRNLLKLFPEIVRSGGIAGIAK